MQTVWTEVWTNDKDRNEFVFRAKKTNKKHQSQIFKKELMTQTMYNTYSEMDFYIFNVQTQSQTQETKTKLKSKTVEKSCQQTHWAEPKKTEVVPAALHPHNPAQKNPKTNQRMCFVRNGPTLHSNMTQFL